MPESWPPDLVAAALLGRLPWVQPGHDGIDHAADESVTGVPKANVVQSPDACWIEVIAVRSRIRLPVHVEQVERDGKASPATPRFSGWLKSGR